MRNKLTLVGFLAATGFVGVASAGPVGYWTFDGNVTDQSSNGSNGTAANLTYVNSVPGPLSGTRSQSGSFDGADTTFAVPVSSTTSPLYLNNTETITLWMKALNTDQTGPYRRSFSSANGTGIEIQEDAGGTGASVRIDTSAGTNQLTSIGNVYDGNWHFVALVLDSGSVKTYLDGSLANSATYNAGSGFGSTNPITFGNSDQESNDWYKGSVSNAAIYGQALTSDQVSALYAGASPLSVPEPASACLLGLAAAAALARRRRA